MAQEVTGQSGNHLSTFGGKYIMIKRAEIKGKLRVIVSSVNGLHPVQRLRPAESQLENVALTTRISVVKG